MAVVRIAKKFAKMEPEMLEPGYGGVVTGQALAFIKYELHRRPGLRVKWGFKKDQQRFSDRDIQHVALLEVHHTKDCPCDWKWLNLDYSTSD